jgi:hypothetical protein
MSTIVTRSGKGSPLTHNEVDTNFTNLNSDKTENATAAITGGNINNTVIGNTTPNAATFTTLTANSTSQFGRGSANYAQATGGATTKAVEFRSLGSDTNVALALRSQGTGAINLAPGSSGVNISNGDTVTAITRTAAGSGYTTIPALAISAPTTAGGVQATATPTMLLATGPTVASGGSGYTVGDVLTLSGGTFSTVARVTVATLSGSSVATVTVTSSGTYSALPTNPVSVTGGTGSGATFNLTWAVQSGFTITNAGSGYVEQPTVTFSGGGGGSGAAAFASVGAGTVIRSLGTTGAQSIDFQGPSSIGTGVPNFRVRDTGANSFLMAGSAADTATLFAQGAANAVLTLASNGTQSVRIGTNGSSTVEQLRVAHTASAVNYVQVTGAATGNQPNISTQGSDANVILNLASKGNANIIFNANGAEQFRTGAVASSVNSLQLNGATTGNSPSLQARGTNTDIDVVFTPKGTGNVRFGTFTTLGAEVITGYITVKDSGGTIRKLAIIA